MKKKKKEKEKKRQQKKIQPLKKYKHQQQPCNNHTGQSCIPAAALTITSDEGRRLSQNERIE